MSILSDVLEVIHDGFNRLSGRTDAVEKEQADLKTRLTEIEAHFSDPQIRATLDKMRAAQGSAPVAEAEPVADAPEPETDPDTGLPVTA